MTDSVGGRQVSSSAPEEHDHLARTLGVGALVLYGLGTIIGAGIYVLVGEVAGAAGIATPIAFVLAAVLAGLTGLSYAELVARHPAAEGSVAFVHEAFRSPFLSGLTGVAFAAIGIVAAASIALGGAGYLARWVPVPAPILAGLVVAAFTVVASLRVAESVRIAALMSAVEILGLCLVLWAGAPVFADLGDYAYDFVPSSGDAWFGLATGTFVAFFAYIGFEGMANMAEETRDVGRTLPRAILVAIAISAVLYGLVSLVAVMAVPLEILAGNPSPLAPVLERFAPNQVGLFIAIGVVATLNGVLIEIVVVSRLAFGMARRGHWSPWLGRLNKRTRTPVHATLMVGAIVLLLATVVPFQSLVHVTSGLTLAVFTAVNASLWQLKRKAPNPPAGATRVPRFVPIAGAVACAALLVLSVVRPLVA